MGRGHGRDQGTARGPGLLAVVLALAGLCALLVVALDRAPVQPPPPTDVPSAAVARVLPTAEPARAAPRNTADRVDGPLLGQSEPTELRIPAIGVSSRLVRLGLDGSGAMQVPADPQDAGWFTGAPTPGALGPAVIAGHVSWDRAPAVFFRLGELRPGDRVEVRRRDRRTAVFVVSELRRYAKARFPTEAVYGTTDHAGLRLITCGGRYDVGERRFRDNIVVFARLVDVRFPR
jgi:hypothetical protein